jgi:hypothetical protein
MSDYLYKNGLPFDTKLSENLNDIDNRIRKNFASMLICDGGVGQGKTTLMVQCADYINKLHELAEINLSKQLAMGGADFLKKLRICYDEKLPVIIYTEAGDFNKRGSLTKFNAIINRTFETFRAFQIVVILDLPSFHVLDNDLFDKNIPRLLLHLKGRKETYGNYQGYSLYRMMYIKHKMGKLVVKPFAYDLVDDNFRGQFKNLPTERRQSLDRISIRGKLKILRKSEVEAAGLLTFSALATKLEMSISWVQHTIKNLGLKEERRLDRVKYFDEFTLNKLADYIEHREEKKRGPKKLT